MRLVTVVFTALVLSLVACHVEGPEAGKAKRLTPPNTKPVRTGLLFWGEADKGGLPDQLFVVGADLTNGTLSIRAIDWNEDKGEYTPLDGAAGCIDHFTDVETEGWGTAGSTYKKRKGNITLEVFISKRVIKLALYEITDIDGNTVKYVNSTREIPSPASGEMFRRLLLEGEDCDHVSQSGEEGSGAPGGG